MASPSSLCGLTSSGGRSGRTTGVQYRARPTARGGAARSSGPSRLPEAGHRSHITHRTPVLTTLTMFRCHRTPRSVEMSGGDPTQSRNHLSPLSPEKVVYAGLAFRNSPRFPHLWTPLLITGVLPCKNAIFSIGIDRPDLGFLNRRNPICGVQCHMGLWKMCPRDSTMARRFRHETSATARPGGWPNK
jgi:hypothetical protein